MPSRVIRKVKSMNSSEPDLQINRWDRFWFAPESTDRISRTRGLLSLITAVYFISAFADVSFWYAEGGPFSPHNTSSFWRIAGLEQETRWNISPLFLTDNPLIYHGYLVVGVMLCCVVAAGKGGRPAAFALWAMLVGWANRAMILSGLTETLLSLGLFAAAIAPAAPAWESHRQSVHWTARLARQLIAVQITMVGLGTFVTMLGGRVWFNGLGAYALAAPWQNRTIDWTGDDSILVNATMHESLTHMLVFALPIGLLLAWRVSATRYGKATLTLWCLAIACLGSLWLYTASFAVMVWAIGPSHATPSSDTA
jgi:hypothetical protein